jgi:SAM-dependent methyltransferase
MKANDPVRQSGPLDQFLARLRHGIACRKLKTRMPIERCLDIGCGAYPALLIRLPAQQKYGLEQSVSADLAQAAAAHGIRLVQCDLCRSAPLPFGENFFDVVTLLAVIEHINPPDVPPLLSEIHRILKPGGVLMLTTPAAWTDALLRGLAFCRLISRREIEDHKDRLTRRKIKTYLASAGFTAIQTGTFECFMNLWGMADKIRIDQKPSPETEPEQGQSSNKTPPAEEPAQ